MLKKQVTKDKFGNRLYLLGRDTDGYNVYLEYPSWDCGWYWGFGYIERYTNKTRPDIAPDLSSHTHWNYGIVGTEIIKDKYIYHINNNPYIEETVLTDAESWQLSELMKQFYILSAMAELAYYGSAHVTSIENSPTRNMAMYNKINRDMLPAIFKIVDELLSPNTI